MSKIFANPMLSSYAYRRKFKKKLGFHLSVRTWPLINWMPKNWFVLFRFITTCFLMKLEAIGQFVYRESLKNSNAAFGHFLSTSIGQSLFWACLPKDDLSFCRLYFMKLSYYFAISKAIILSISRKGGALFLKGISG